MANVYTDEGKLLLNLKYMRTKAMQYAGLQDADPIPWESGLLFPTSGGTGYHMHNVRYPIDICFVDNNNTILKVTTMEPEHGGATAPPSAIWAIETNAGFWQSNSLGIGSKIILSDT